MDPSQRVWMIILASLPIACGPPSESVGGGQVPFDTAAVRAEVEAGVTAFHAADTARDSQAVIDLLWTDYSMFVDGQRADYSDVVAGSRAFMSTLDLFATEWSDLRISVLAEDFAVSSFVFRDSIISKDGELIRALGPTTFGWLRRDGEGRVIFADADHYPIVE